MSDKSQKKLSSTKDWRTWIGILIVVVAVVFIWGLSWYFIDNYIASSSPTQTVEAARGVFGDKFGAINALFSGLAFAGIIITILLQKKELTLQRKDIEEQNNTLQQQRFESSFFNLLTLHSEIVDKLEIAAHKQRHAFEYFILQLKLNSDEFSAFHPLSRLTRSELHQLRESKVLSEEMKKKLSPPEISTIEAMLEKNPGIVGKYLDEDKALHCDLIDKAYSAAHEKTQDGLSHYFRNLYHLIKFIDDSDLISSDAKIKYIRIVRAQLSDSELVALLYNCLASNKIINGRVFEFGYPKMTALAIKYDLFQNINHRNLIHPFHQDLNLKAEQVKK